VATLIFILQIAQEKLVLAFPSWKWLAAVGQVDFYHSRGFFVLFALFCINLIGCTFKRLPRTIAILKSSSKVPDDEFLNSLNSSLEVVVNGSKLSRENLQSIISAHFSKPQLIKDDGGSLYFYAEKGRYTHLGFYLAHVCILLIAIGTILSSRGFQSSFDVARGQLLDPLVVRDAARQEKALDFALRCDDLKTVPYGESEKLKKHMSTLTILQGGAAVKTQDLDFGTHLTYKGVDIYQDRFSKTINYAKLQVSDSAGKQKEYELKIGDSFSVGDTAEKLRLTRVKQDSVQLKAISSPGSLWVSKSPVQFAEPSLQGYRFSLVELLQKETTSLKAIYDPGKDLIWYSFIAMIAGFSICSFLSHQRLWVRMDMQEGRCRVMLAGAATKNQSAFINVLNKIKAELEAGLKP